MWYLAVKDSNGSYYIDEVAENWHDAVDNFEPIDCINGKMLIYDEQGRKYQVGPNKQLREKKLFWKIKSVEVGHWDFDKGEPYLIDTKEVAPKELQALLKNFKP